MNTITADWLTDPAAQRVFAMFDAAGHQAFAVGGCVRNSLLGVAVDDVDISTDATPDQTIALAEGAGIKAVPTGIDHGTVTLVVDRATFEVTTFRADVETDGRHAIVRFSKDVADDAVRRDFTVNALYCDAQGNVIDPLGGLPDLKARRIRFIQDPDKRIREDYLRILRFFRFSAFYADPDAGFAADTLAAIAANLDGLETLSRERVGTEMKKLLCAADPSQAVAVMEQTGVLMRVCPGSSAKALPPLVHLEQGLGIAPDAIRRLVSLGISDAADLRLSKAEQRRIATLQEIVARPDSAEDLGYWYGADMAVDGCLLRAAMLEQALSPDVIAEIRTGAEQKFPISAKDLQPDYSGPSLGQRLRSLERTWVKSKFQLTRQELLDHPEIE